MIYAERVRLNENNSKYHAHIIPNINRRIERFITIVDVHQMILVILKKSSFKNNLRDFIFIPICTIWLPILD